MFSMFMWRVLAIACLVVFVGCIVALCILKLLKNSYYFSYKEDELIKETKSVNSKNYLYFTSDPVTYKYIKRYVLCKTISEKYCICNYDREFNKVVFYVIQYNKKHKVIGVTKCIEIKNGEASRVIPLNKKTDRINVIVSKIDKMEINTSVIKPHNRIKILVYSFIKFLLSFSIMFAIRHGVVELFGESYACTYLNSVYDLYTIIGILALSVIISIVSNVSLRKKNIAMNRGGVIEYEFI